MRLSVVMAALLVAQVLTFVALGVCWLATGNWRFGVAQVLLAAVQAVIYSGGIRA